MNKKDEEIMLFLRFLKDNNIHKEFVKKFYHKNGMLFRQMYTETRDFIDVSIIFYFKSVKSKNFIFDAFDWGPDDVWSEWHHEWANLLNKKRNG